MTRALAPTATRKRGIQHYGSIGLEFRPLPLGKVERTVAVDSVVDGLKNAPNRFALVEIGAASRACAAKWRLRGVETRTFVSESVPGTFDIYARWNDFDALEYDR